MNKKRRGTLERIEEEEENPVDQIITIQKKLTSDSAKAIETDPEAHLNSSFKLVESYFDRATLMANSTH